MLNGLAFRRTHRHTHTHTLFTLWLSINNSSANGAAKIYIYGSTSTTCVECVYFTYICSVGWKTCCKHTHTRISVLMGCLARSSSNTTVGSTPTSPMRPTKVMARGSDLIAIWCVRNLHIIVLLLCESFRSWRLASNFVFNVDRI